MNRPAALLLGCCLIAGCSPKTELTHREPDGPAALPEPGRRGTFTIGPDTTVVDGPLLPTGQIDYIAALNDRLAKGVTPETNAAVLLWQALGPTPPDRHRVPPGFFDRLGMPAPPPVGRYYVTHPMFRDRQVGPPHPSAAAYRQPWTTDEFPDVANWLDDNAEPLALVAEAAKRPAYYSPQLLIPSPKESPGLVHTRLPTTQLCRELAAAFAARAMLRCREGETADAWQDLLTCHRIGRMIGRGGAPIDALVAFAIEQVACQADLAFIEHTKPGPDQVRSYLRDLAGLPPLPDVAAKVGLAERFMMLDFVMLTDRYGLAHFRGFAKDGEDFFANLVLDGADWDPALRTANGWIDRFVAVLRRPTRAERTEAFELAVADLVELKARASQPDALARRLAAGIEPARAKGEAIGDIIVSLMLPAIGKVQVASDLAHQAHANVTVAFALAAYRHDHGKHPAALADLAPKYLAAVPGDLFSGGPLVYKPEKDGYLLSSVGPDGEDDHGRGPGDDPPGDDLAVRMPGGAR
ncbi:MAG: hypothetical protein K2X82_19810 [Gemmataceae bacterium]|nr:hypothetical protein [Gemmataceae bacterium]